MDFDKRYFIVSINFHFPYQFTMTEGPDGTFVDTKTSLRYRKRLLYDCGWGQEEGYELLPSLSFLELIALVECVLPPKPKLKQKKLFWKHSLEEAKDEDIRGLNLLGAVSVIMQDHIEELIVFLTEKNKTDYFTNSSIRENFKWFSFSSQKTREEGRIPGGILTQSYEDVLNQYQKWREISSRVIELVYQ